MLHAGDGVFRPQPRCGRLALQIETFDPHEPFFAPERFREAFPTNYRGPIFDWPPYAKVDEEPDEIAELRANYCAVLALCDFQLGRLLDDSTGATCGATPRWWSPPTTASCSASTTGGPRTA